MSDLKPCMCCESNDIEIITFEEKYHTRKIAKCMDCGARGSVCDSKEEAIEAWNTRPAEDALTAEVERLKGELALEEDAAELTCIRLARESENLKAEVEELRYIVKQFEQWRGDDDTGCPKYQDQNYPCGGEKEFKEKFGEDADFDTVECDEWGEGCWVKYYRWLYRQKLGKDTNVPANAPDTNVGKMEEK